MNMFVSFIYVGHPIVSDVINLVRDYCNSCDPIIPNVKRLSQEGSGCSFLQGEDVTVRIKAEGIYRLIYDN